MWTEDYVMAVMHERERQATDRRGHHGNPLPPRRPNRFGWLRRLRRRRPSSRSARRRTALRALPDSGK
jgi:hypothetical protein